jgi:type I restriction enzyme S subunit
MATDWPLLTIAECASEEPYSTQIGPFGKALTPEAYKPSGVPLLRGVNVNSGRFHDDDYVFISEEDADRLYKFESFPGDVLLVHKGTLGPIGLMPENRKYARYIMGNSMMRVRCDRSKLLPDYLRYWLESPAGQSYLLSRVSQVGVPQLQRPLTTLREAVLPVPPLPMQEQIVGVLGSLDDKIEQNRRTGQALEALARATFKAWFVDFEPVKAKAASATNFPGMPPAAFAALPDRLTDSPLGPVPQGWEVRPIGELVSVKGGGTPSTKVAEYWEGGTHFWATPKDLSGLEFPVLLGTERRITNSGAGCISSGVMPENTVLLSSRAPVGYTALAKVPVAVNQGFIAMVCDGLLPPHYVLHWTRSALEEIKSRASGTTFPEISKTAFRPIPAVVPTAPVVAGFERIAQSLFDLLQANARQSHQLGEVRDYLLPRLLSGSVSVRV